RVQTGQQPYRRCAGTPPRRPASRRTSSLITVTQACEMLLHSAVPRSKLGSSLVVTYRGNHPHTPARNALIAVAASLALGRPVAGGQVIASRFYEALRRELKQSPIDDTKRVALIAASDRCERIAAATINPSAMLDELRKAIAVLADEHPSASPPP